MALPVSLLAFAVAATPGCVRQQEASSRSAASSGGLLLWNGDFDTGDFRQWKSASDRLTTVTRPVREGQYAARFTAYESDTAVSGDPRAQSNAPALHREGNLHYIGWSTYFPRRFPAVPRGAWFVFFQWHGPPWNGTSPRLGFGVAPDGRIELRRDKKYRYDRVWSKRLVRGRWIDFTVRIKWSKDASVGTVRLWVDGVQQRFANGRKRLDMATIQSHQTAVQTIATNYRKRGSIRAPVTILHDAVKIGTTYAAVQP